MLGIESIPDPPQWKHGTVFSPWHAGHGRVGLPGPNSERRRESMGHMIQTHVDASTPNRQLQPVPCPLARAAFLFAALLAAALAAAPAYQVILDVEDPCFEIRSGEWTLSKTGAYLSHYRWTIPGPGTGAARARWIAEGLPAGDYLIEFWADDGDYPSDARYQVISAEGVDDLVVDMNHLATGWHALGTFRVHRVCVVNVSDLWEGTGTLLSVDALRFTLQTALPPPPVSPVPPHIGICIDDAGSVDPTSPSAPIYQMLRLPFAMTFAVMPQLSHTVQTANEVHLRGSEVILHQPMAAITVPNPGAGGITDAMTPAEARAVLAANLDALPHVVGMNNHMGSLITQRADTMAALLDELRDRSLFFYDSRTITTSVAFDLAQDRGLLTGERDLFIDGASQAEAMDLIRSLAQRALYAPEIPHLAIGHVRSATAAALAAIAPELEAMGVEVWPISRCVAQVIEADRVPRGAAFSTVGDWTEDPADAYSKLLRDDHALTALLTDGSDPTRALFTASLPIPGLYDLYAIWSSGEANAPGALARVTHWGGITDVPLDQSASFDTWVHLGRFPVSVTAPAQVELRDGGASASGQILRADALRWVYADTLPPRSDPSGLLLR